MRSGKSSYMESSNEWCVVGMWIGGLDIRVMRGSWAGRCDVPV